jgi:vacuolar-type H+-ATPase subunit H
MSSEKISRGVENIEAEAEKILEAARSQANQILVKAREEVAETLASELPLDEVETERQRIVSKAKKEAGKKVEGSRKKALEIKAEAGKKVEEIANRMVNIITEAGSR